MESSRTPVPCQNRPPPAFGLQRPRNTRSTLAGSLSVLGWRRRCCCAWPAQARQRERQPVPGVGPLRCCCWSLLLPPPAELLLPCPARRQTPQTPRRTTPAHTEPQPAAVNSRRESDRPTDALLPRAANNNTTTPRAPALATRNQRALHRQSCRRHSRHFDPGPSTPADGTSPRPPLHFDFLAAPSNLSHPSTAARQTDTTTPPPAAAFASVANLTRLPAVGKTCDFRFSATAGLCAVALASLPPPPPPHRERQ